MREGWRGFRNGCALNDIWLIGAWRCMASHNKRLFFHYSLIELRFCFSFGRACFRRLRRFDRWGVGSLGEIEYGVGLYEWTRHLNMNGRLRLQGIQMVHICWIPPAVSRTVVICRGTLAFVAVGIAFRCCRRVAGSIESEGWRGDSPAPLSSDCRLPFWPCVGWYLIVDREAWYTPNGVEQDAAGAVGVGDDSGEGAAWLASATDCGL